MSSQAILNLCVFLGKHAGLCHPACVLQIIAKDETEQTPAEFLSLPSNIQGPHSIMFPTMSLLHFSCGCPHFSLALRGWCARSQSCHQYYIVLCKSALPVILMLCDHMCLCPDLHIPIFILLYGRQLQQRQQIEMVD